MGELYYVVVNDEEQYSIWESTAPVPVGWSVVGEPASKERCLDEIETLWTDMRPASVRRWMQQQEAAAGQNGQADPELASARHVEDAPEQITPTSRPSGCAGTSAQ